MRSLYELSRRRKCHVEEGMTLLEMLFVAALVTVLVTAVRPFCQKHLNRIHPAEAQTYLLRIASLQTQYRLKFGKYFENLADLNRKPNASVEQHYRISIDFPEAHAQLLLQNIVEQVAFDNTQIPSSSSLLLLINASVNHSLHAYLSNPHLYLLVIESGDAYQLTPDWEGLVDTGSVKVSCGSGCRALVTRCAAV